MLLLLGSIGCLDLNELMGVDALPGVIRHGRDKDVGLTAAWGLVERLSSDIRALGSLVGRTEMDRGGGRRVGLLMGG